MIKKSPCSRQKERKKFAASFAVIHGKLSVTKDIDAVLGKIEHWHQGSIAAFKIMYRDEYGVWNGVRWNGQRASLFTLGETDEKKAMAKLLC